MIMSFNLRERLFNCKRALKYLGVMLLSLQNCRKLALVLLLSSDLSPDTFVCLALHAIAKSSNPITR